MIVQDILLLIRKITIGIIITLVPLFIIGGILWLIQNVFLWKQIQSHKEKLSGIFWSVLYCIHYRYYVCCCLLRSQASGHGNTRLQLLRD